MYLTEKLAIILGKKARIFLNADKNKEQIIVYGAINLLQIIFSILYVIVTGFILGVLYEALIFSTTASILRKYSGGVHAISPNRCIITSTILAGTTGLIIDKFLYKLPITHTLILNIIIITSAFIIIILKAPVDSIKKPIIDPKMKKIFKKKSIITLIIFSAITVILFINYEITFKFYYLKIIQSITFGILWQSITLTKYGTVIFNGVDLSLKFIIERN